MRQIELNEIHWELLAEQDDTPVRGNAICSGDDDYDRQIEDEIIERLNNGDEWAWASVTVRGSWNGIVASEYLGCCSYRDADDFRNDGGQGYYSDMREAVRAEIQSLAESIATAIA